MRSIVALLFVVSSACAADCDRPCLQGFVTRYLDAMIAHNPSALPLSDKARFTENSEEMRLGEGLWKNVSGLRSYRQDILDVRQGVAASQVVVEEAGSPALLALRLKIADRRITEVEAMVTRSQKEGALFNIDGLQTPRKEMAAVPPRDQLPAREEAIRLAEFYPAGLKVGSFVAVDAPFAADAYRLENGRIMAGPGCSRAGCENIKIQNIIKHPAITTRVQAVDEDLGIVLLWMNFGDTGSYGAGNALVVWEAFKVFGGQIHAVEAFMRVMPATTGSGWDSLDPLAIDKQHYKLEIENQWVRVFRESMAPRETMPMHRHPAPGAVIVFFTDRFNRLTSPEGVSRELRDHAGDVMWAVASTHRSENLTDALFEAVQIEPRRPSGTPASFAVDKLDATRVDPEHYHVEFENEYVRVLRVTIGPHEKLRLHTHPATGAVLVHLTDQNLRLTLADGTVRINRYAAKQVHWAAPAGAHQDENLSDAPLRFIRVELKLAGGEIP